MIEGKPDDFIQGPFPEILFASMGDPFTLATAALGWST